MKHVCKRDRTTIPRSSRLTQRAVLNQGHCIEGSRASFTNLSNVVLDQHTITSVESLTAKKTHISPTKKRKKKEKKEKKGNSFSLVAREYVRARARCRLDSHGVTGRGQRRINSVHPINRPLFSQGEHA